MAVYTKRQKDQKYDHIKKIYDNKEKEVVIEDEKDTKEETSFEVVNEMTKQNKLKFIISSLLIILIGSAGYVISLFL
jgi:regulatory protein YycH of two-component signal transduction system YycFG